MNLIFATETSLTIRNYIEATVVALNFKHLCSKITDKNIVDFVLKFNI